MKSKCAKLSIFMYGDDILRLHAEITLVVSQAGLLQVSAIAALTMETKPSILEYCMLSVKSRKEEIIRFQT